MADIAVTESRTGTIDWSAAIWAGVIAGLIFMVLEMMMAPMFAGAPSIWAPPRMIGAIALGQDALPPPASFDFGIFMTAMVLHFILSILYAIVLAWIIARFDLGVALLIGAVYGLMLYLVNFYIFTAVFPWFANARNWVSVFVHILFGVLAAWGYIALRSRRQERAVV